MFANKQSTPFVAKLRPSTFLQQLSLVVHALASIASITNALPLAIKLFVLALVLLNGSLAYRKLRLESRKIRCNEKRGWAVAWQADFENVEVLGSTVITTFCVFLHLQGKPPILIARDAMDENNYRRLIVQLKMTKLQQ